MEPLGLLAETHEPNKAQQDTVGIYRGTHEKTSYLESQPH